MDYKICYAYHQTTNEYIGIDRLMPNPVRPGTYFIKDNVTEMPPPAAGENEKQVWTGAGWIILEDHRGTGYWTRERQHKLVTELGPLPEDYLTETTPPGMDYEWNDETSTWELPAKTEEANHANDQNRTE